MLQQPVRVGGLAVAYALAASTLVLVAFLVSNLVLSVVGDIGGVAGDPGPQDEAAPAAVLLSAGQDDSRRVDSRPADSGRPEGQCARRDADARGERGRDVHRCADERRGVRGSRP